MHHTRSTFKQEFEDLHSKQKVSSIPSEPIPVRRSERIHLQQEKTISSCSITRSQARNHADDDISIQSYETNEDYFPEHFGTNPSEGNQEFDHNYLAIRAESINEKKKKTMSH